MIIETPSVFVSSSMGGASKDAHMAEKVSAEGERKMDKWLIICRNQARADFHQGVERL